jgi:uncharacterized membrane protein
MAASLAPFAAGAAPFPECALPGPAFGRERVVSPSVEPSAMSSAPSHRLPALDVVRGAVMVLMAIDHVRVYAGVPPGGPTPGVFFTRWVTHFCAPAFVFLAGTAAYLYRRKAGSTAALSSFLVTRGLWLVLLELTVLRFGWTFNVDYAHFTFAGVIWMLGWCMVALAALAWLPLWLVATVGLLLIVGHNAVAPALYAVQDPNWLLRLLYVGGGFTIPGLEWNVIVLYVLVPWVGVMAAGYAFGRVMTLDAAQRRRACWGIGGGAIALFVALRATGAYGDPNPWNPSLPALAFLGTAKYPASLLFLLMTLGPTIAVLPWLETARGRVSRWLELFGRVPFFYYVLHIPLIHLVALAIAAVRTPGDVGWLVANHPMLPPEVPRGYMWSLPLLYLVTLAVVVTLYFPCRWFARVKATTQRWWLQLL